MPDRIAGLLESAVAARAIPGAVALTSDGGSYVAGLADTINPRPMTADTVFDVASLTKVVATTTASLALIGGGQLSLDDAVTGYLPDARWPGSVTVRHLLTHTSGLPASVKFYERCDTREQVLDELYRTPLEAPPGTRVVYSDLGFMALGELVAAVAAEPLEAAVHRLVTAPLQLNSAGYNPSGPPGRFAATEVYDGSAAVLARGDDPPEPPGRGVVHDENARVLGGIAGHAGLFCTAADLARFARWWTGPGDGPVPARLRQEATTCQTSGLPGQDGFPGCRGLGWVSQGDRYDILDGIWPATSVSHTGFTGTSLALDPESGRWVVLLTNAVHFGRDATAVKALRRAVHAATAAPSPFA